jgi:hypothetical protein
MIVKVSAQGCRCRCHFVTGVLYFRYSYASGIWQKEISAFFFGNLRKRREALVETHTTRLAQELGS